MKSIAAWRRLLNTLLNEKMNILAGYMAVLRAMNAGEYHIAQELLNDQIGPLRTFCAALDQAAAEATSMRYATG